MTQDTRTAETRRRRTLGLCVSLGLVAAIGVIGCATVGGDPGQSLVPARLEAQTGPFAVYTNAPLPPDASSVRSLQGLEHDLQSHLGLRVPAEGPPIEVYILKDRDAFGHFLTFYYPELPPRRAFFLAQGARRVIYTFYNDRLDEDLRHEATHALLHAAVGDLPLWLDEGLAEYFEVPEGRLGLNAEHIAHLPDDVEAGWRPDLARLETLASVREMTPRDYRESWAWVHYLLSEPGPGKDALIAFLADSKTSPLSARLAQTDRGDAQRILAHLRRVRSAPVASSVVKADATVLLQSAAIESSPSTPPRKSLLTRFLAMIGLGKSSEQ